jgi:Mn-containing catalase
MVSTAVNLLNGHEVETQAVQSGHIESQVLTGLNPYLANASGFPWTAAYVNVTGDLPADLLSNIAAEQRAKVVYEYLHRQINDKHVRQMIDFLLNREEAHNTLFRQAFTRIQDSSSQRNWGVDEDARLYFDLSTPGKYFDINNPQAPSFNSPDTTTGH